MVVGIIGLFYLYQTKAGLEEQPIEQISKPSPDTSIALAKFLDNLSSQGKRDYIYISKTIGTRNGPTTQSLHQHSKEDKSSWVVIVGGKEIVSFIRIGNTTYIKDYTDGKWFKNDKQPSENLRFPNDPNQKITNYDGPTNEYRFLNIETCDSGLGCYKYQVLNNSFPDTLMYVWFDDSEFLTRKNLFREKDGSEITVEYTYTIVNINEPSPLKPL